jgi:hypothetical protein
MTVGWSLPFLIDVDGDGQDESVWRAREPPYTDVIRVIDTVNGQAVHMEVESFPEPIGMEGVDSLSLVDVDNDGLLELIIHIGWAVANGIILYKFRNGRLELMTRESEDGVVPALFVEGVAKDLDGDGKVEVISEPRAFLTGEDVPEDYVRDPHEEEAVRGRLRYVHRWDKSRRRFVVRNREVVSVGAW